MFHRVPYDAVLDLPSSRFFQMAERLKYRGGAVTAALRALEEVSTPPPPPELPAVARDAVGTADELAAMAAMSRNDAGFPGIGYSGG